MINEVRALAASGVLGSGFLESSLERALEWEPDFIGCDAGSTDSGPSSLGLGTCGFSRSAVKRDLRLMLLAARSRQIPLIVGSAGTAGAEPNLTWTVDIAREIAREDDIHFTLAIIHSEQDKAYLKCKLSAGKIKPLRPAPPFDENVIDRSERIVGMMGAEPFIEALEQGADVVIAGRSSDTSIFAAVPTQRGLNPGPVWHAAKILECGAACVVHREQPDCMFARIRDDHFIVEPPNLNYRCSPLSVAAHTLYENSSPFHLYEPSGMLDMTPARYEAESDRSVRVTGSAFAPTRTYTVKLEGVEKAGYQTVVLGGVRDPVLIGQIDEWIDRVKDKLRERVAGTYGAAVAESGYRFNVRVYGRYGVLGPAEPRRDEPAHELMLIMEATASTQETATAIASSARHIALHLPIPQWKGLISNLAFPYTPAYIERGAVYRFNVNHVVEPAHPCEMFPMDVERI